ncbi:Phosphotransferase enzyme family protein [Actinokineospora iranica]|uniref:Phosphotransferase enzyme family protein n=1 Tax=Actinokineospora iranica TaxID=1271860 RepID=A0A1G6K1J7_9PSEU|nr:Phosphotransferase enzyme family protein [Actinokineospora iranica]
MVSPFDIRQDQHDDVLERVEVALGVRLDRGSVVYGIYGVTEGFRSDRETWVRVECRSRWRGPGAAWIGLEAASAIPGVPKPDWYQSTTWVDPGRELVWRADEVELITSPSVSAAGGLAVAAGLPDFWWQQMRDSLAELGAYETKRVGMAQAHLSKRINQVFDGLDTTVEEWATAHADLHWSNVTTDGRLLDWGDWGAAPRGYDAATLWQASLPNPALAERVQREFAADLGSRSGLLSQLLKCANAIRIARNRGTATPLLEPAKAAVPALLEALRT